MSRTIRITTIDRFLPLALLAATALFAADADAQTSARRRPTAAPPAEPVSAPVRVPTRVRSQALAKGGYAVVVDLDQNRLFFAHGRRILWSAPVGTGTGLRLESDRDAWDFHTPNGTYHVAYKEREPDWIAPDWYFLEHKLPVPGPNDSKRRFPRGLGSAAVFIGHGLAIHGTDKPELLGQRVSHGCIRLANADALRLFHNVQVGTEVVIVGGDREVQAPPAAPARQAAARPSRPEGEPPPRDPFIVELEDQSTAALLARLDDELFADAFSDASHPWTSVASVLLLRGTKEDDDGALAGLLTRVDQLGEGRLRDEYATFIADAFNQGPLRTLEVMGRMDRAGRAAAARALVSAAIGLYPGDGGDGDASAPWPTRRAPREALGDRYSQRAWDTLKAAEDEYRDARGLTAAARRAEL